MLYPLKFKPLLKERIWGGNRLAEVMDKKLPAGTPIGESWEVSGVPGDLSVVSNGNLKNNNIEELIEIFMGDLVGEKVYERFGLEFPLLLKLLDARDDLSLQVHPDDELARFRHGCNGKSELWYIIDCDPGAYIYLGFKKDTSITEYRQAVRKGKVQILLNKIPIRPGQAYYIPAGTIHSLSRNALIAEIEQTSDVTYRIHDWDRTDSGGNSRELHHEMAEEAIDFMGNTGRSIEITPQPNKEVPIGRDEYFCTNYLRIEGEKEMNYSSLDSYVALLCLQGKFSLGFSGGTETVSKGQAILIPAQEEYITLRGDGDFIEVYSC